MSGGAAFCEVAREHSRMLDRILHVLLQQRLIILVVGVVALGFGLDAARRLSVDAFPDVANVQVQVATEVPGRSPDEVERLVTVPIEMGMTGLPGMTEMRSQNEPGLSIVTLVFDDDTPIYFARQLVMERLPEIRSRVPEGIIPVPGPVSSALSEVYQFTLEKPDDGQRPLTREELTARRTIQDWVVRPLLRSIQGVAEINSTGGYKAHLETAHFKKYKTTTQKMVKSLELVETDPIILGAKGMETYRK